MFLCILFVSQCLVFCTTSYSSSLSVSLLLKVVAALAAASPAAAASLSRLVAEVPPLASDPWPDEGENPCPSLCSLEVGG